MIDFKEAGIAGMSIHGVGNKLQEEEMLISEEPVQVDSGLSGLLTRYYTQPFKDEVFYQFRHETDLKFNEVYAYVRSVFQDPGQLHLQSVKLARHLYEQSGHPNIKSGELHVVFFKGCLVDDEVTDAVGIFKSETKETYLRIYPEGRKYAVEKDDGININKMDKGCIVFNMDEEDGYRVMIVDNTNKSGEARYWKEEFLQLKPREDSFFHTHNYLKMCRSFALEAFPEADKVDQLGLIEDSAAFFRQSEVFDKISYEEKVLKEPEIIDAFEHYKETYKEEKGLPLYDEFDVNTSALRKLKRVFKSVIRLDKNFHIYVHGNRDLIRKGYDEESGMHFYQLFFLVEQ